MTQAARPSATSSIRCIARLLLLNLVVIAGCSTKLPPLTWGGWIAGFEQAERTARSSNKPMFIHFRTTDMGEQDAMHDALQSAAVKAHTAGHVCCCVFHSHETDRRFMRQFGVERAPALVVVHSDGTFHAQSGPQSAEQIARFLENATSSGAAPLPDPLIPREVTYDWHASLDAAESAAAKTGQPVFLVLDRWMTRDWHRLEPMLATRDVHSRVADMVHCRPSAGLWSGVESAQKRFAIANLPAVVVIRPDGEHLTLELPTSSEAIARFLDSARAAMNPATASSKTED